VWALIGEGATRESIVRAIEAEYHMPDGIGLDQLQHDVTTLIADMQRAGLLAVDGPSGGR